MSTGLRLFPTLLAGTRIALIGVNLMRAALVIGSGVIPLAAPR